MSSLPMTRLAWHRGLLRYRGDRIGLLGELGRDQRDAVLTSVGPLRLAILTAADLAQAVLQEEARRYTKSRGLSIFARPLLGDGLLSAEGETHRRHRKLLAPGFQSRRISRYAADMIGLTTAMLDGWRPGEQRDFAQEMMRLTVAIAAKTMFGAAGVSADEVGANLDVANRWVIDRASSPLPIPLHWPTPGNRAMRAALARLDEIVYDIIRERRARRDAAGSDEAGDILGMLLDAQDEEDGGRLDDRQVRDEVMTFFMAGHETTANALAWTFHALGHQPAALAALQRELDQVLAGRPPTVGDLDALPYTRAVWNEVLRLYPPAYMIGRRAAEPVEVAGTALPAGSYVLVNVYGMHRRGDLFPDPTQFRPERFLADATPPTRGTYIPFGIGPRVCIGNQFAAQEGMLLIAGIFQRLAPRLSTPAEIAIEPLITLRPRDGLPFTVAWRS
jgi:cytochrome P450